MLEGALLTLFKEVLLNKELSWALVFLLISRV